jgi:hypothetical protein
MSVKTFGYVLNGFSIDIQILTDYSCPNLDAVNLPKRKPTEIKLNEDMGNLKC